MYVGTLSSGILSEKRKEQSANVVVSRIALTRPEMASRVEELLVRMGQAGQIRGQVTDEAMKGLLQQVCPYGRLC
jgi:DNA-binding TFAR19-related protein (PDSD5 family)